MNSIDAAHATVHDYPGGSESLGPRAGISPAVLRNKVNPNNETHHLTFTEARRIAVLADDHRMLQAWAHESGFLLIKAPDGSGDCDMSVLEKVAAFMFASGMFGKEIHDSLVDGGVDESEVAKVKDAARRVMTEVVSTVQRMEGMAQ